MKPLKEQNPFCGSSQIFLPKRFIHADSMKFKAIAKSLIPRPINSLGLMLSKEYGITDLGLTDVEMCVTTG